MSAGKEPAGAPGSAAQEDPEYQAGVTAIKAKDYDDEKEAVKSLKDQEETTSPGTIGDLIKAQMGDN